jgi:hypothetical protein
MTASQVTKYGTGKWKLKTSGSTSTIYVNGGTLDIENGTSGTITSGSIRVNEGGRLTGTGTANNVILNKGLMTAGLSETLCGKLNITSSVSALAGSTILCKVGAFSNDKFIIGGNMIHSNDTIRIQVDDQRTLSIGDEITIFTVSGNHQGTYIIDGGKYKWDDSALLTEGKLVLKSITSGIADITVDTKVNVYTEGGILIRKNVVYGKALDGLESGVYIINGKKVLK